MPSGTPLFVSPKPDFDNRSSQGTWQGPCRFFFLGSQFLSIMRRFITSTLTRLLERRPNSFIVGRVLTALSQVLLVGSMRGENLYGGHVQFVHDGISEAWTGDISGSFCMVSHSQLNTPGWACESYRDTWAWSLCTDTRQSLLQRDGMRQPRLVVMICTRLSFEPSDIQRFSLRRGPWFAD